ncbi:hypothetical protein GCM10011352_03850 [Marinobacterium zhoushanense]|uniref:DUF1302 domain-containing protein n=1 Tax=Marinobacterium zhoushanense TaxID=1679163 RepID=A0ABQ1K1Q8_9GAMM|nr:hypothetical protein GCM10011352_03850 [Marinobacterium zhoushanense]
MTAGTACAFQIDTSNPDLNIRWDNTLKYSSAWRVGERDDNLTDQVNANDANLNFDRGLISNRADLLSELDLQYGDFGMRLSAAGWYDDVYQGSNDHPNDGTSNLSSVDYNEFSDEAKKIHGGDVELLDAFLSTRFEAGDALGLVRLGQFGQVWGESLFFGANAIAGGMAPVDVVKLASVPGTQFKEAIRPVKQLSGQVLLTPEISMSAYYQFEWEGNRLPVAGSYFGGSDTVPDGESIILGPGLTANQLSHDEAKNSGQGGIQLRIMGEETDYGLYLIRFHSKNFQQVVNLGVVPFVGPAPVSYRQVYHEGITAVGASASRTFGDVNLAAEVSYRHNQDLASTNALDLSGLGGPATDNSDNPAYAVGNTAHINLSALWSLPPNALFREGDFVGEIAWNRVLNVTKNEGALDPNATRDAVALRFKVEPKYRQVTSGLDLSVPVVVGWAPKGSRSMALGPGAFPADGGGDISVGLNAVYLDSWRLGVNYTHYFGDSDEFLTSSSNYSYQQYMKDRDFVSFSINRTF